MESKVYLPNGARVAPFATNVHVMCDIAPDGAIMAATHKTKGAFEGEPREPYVEWLPRLPQKLRKFCV